MTPLVLVPGMRCDARIFAPQIAAFSGTRPLHLAPIAGHDSVAELARAVLSHAPPSFALAGLSMGGIVAMEILRQCPERLAGIALLDTNPLAETPEVAARRGPQMARVAAGGLDALIEGDMAPAYFADGTDATPLVALCRAMAGALGPEVFARQSRALIARPDQTTTLRDAALPALILCGAQDRLCPVSRHRPMAELMPGAALAIIDEAGHLPTLKRPTETTAAIARWLAEIEATA